MQHVDALSRNPFPSCYVITEEAAGLIEKLRQAAKENISKVQQANKKGFDARRKNARQYHRNQLVAIKRTQMKQGLKLAVKFLGPYQISRVLEKDRYEVCKIGEHEGPRVTIVPAEFFKPWIEPDDDDDEEEVGEDEPIRGRMSEQDDRVVVNKRHEH